MVRYHRSCSYCKIPGTLETDHHLQIETALKHATEHITAGFSALVGDDIGVGVVFRLFQRYFGQYTTLKHNRVREIFRRMACFDMNATADPDNDIMVVLGFNHLSKPTEAYLPKHHLNYPCIIDLSRRGDFDDNGLLKSGSKALVPADLFPIIDYDAFVPQVDNPFLNFEGGKHIFIAPKVLFRSPLQGPFQQGAAVAERWSIDTYSNCLPVILFHELSHTVLTGPPGERLTDEKTSPLESTKGPSSFWKKSGPASAPPGPAHEVLASSIVSTLMQTVDSKDSECMYGDALCSRVASNTVEVHKTLTNADSHALFALGVWLFQSKNFDFSTGYALRLAPIPASLNQSTGSASGDVTQNPAGPIGGAGGSASAQRQGYDVQGNGSVQEGDQVAKGITIDDNSKQDGFEERRNDTGAVTDNLQTEPDASKITIENDLVSTAGEGTAAPGSPSKRKRETHSDEDESEGSDGRPRKKKSSAEKAFEATGMAA